MKKIIITLVGIILVGFWGCSESTSPDPDPPDEQVIQELIQDIEQSDTEDYFYSSLDDESENSFFDTPVQQLLKPIIPMRFGRIGLRPIIRDIRVVMDTDTTATAYFTKIWRGHFVTITLDSAYQVQRIVRPMGHQFNRIAHFVKRGNANQPLRERWHLLDFSMVSGQSLGVVDSNVVRTTLNIEKLVIETDTTIEITDPLDYFQTRQSVFSFEPGTEVTLTVYVENTNPNAIQIPSGQGTEFVRLHFARHRRLRHHGIRYFNWVRSEGDNLNVYQGTWTVGQRFRVNHAAVDVIDNGVIFDDDVDLYPYNSVTWSTPYKVKPIN